MTKPTQAQIEAATKAVTRELSIGGSDENTIAIAALTAAVEVVEADEIEESLKASIGDIAVEVEPLGAAFQKVLHDNLWELKTGKASAAEIGEEYKQQFVLEVEKLEAAIIERCARVADKWHEHDVADAIRALKDKP